MSPNPSPMDLIHHHHNPYAVFSPFSNHIPDHNVQIDHNTLVTTDIDNQTDKMIHFLFDFMVYWRQAVDIRVYDRTTYDQLRKKYDRVKMVLIATLKKLKCETEDRNNVRYH
jgi:hypothetical protein